MEIFVKISGDYILYQRKGLVFSLMTTPFASRSSCTVFAHQPDVAPSGKLSSGK
jgi:hypothetical protein